MPVRSRGQPQSKALSAFASLGQRPSASIGLFPSRAESVREALKRAPRLSPTVSIGGRSYREFDNGQANVLVPASDASVTSAELLRNRQAAVRSLFLANNTLAGVGYGLAALAGASPGVRNQALAVGAAADGLLSGAMARNAPVRRPNVLPPEMPGARLGLPAIRYRERTALGQASGVHATIRKEMLGTGTRIRWNPPGWSGNGKDYNESRAHLHGKQLGGQGRDRENGVTLAQNGANNPQMSTFENGVARQVRGGGVVEYSSTPFYEKGVLARTAILVTARGSDGWSRSRFIRNPAARRK